MTTQSGSSPDPVQQGEERPPERIWVLNGQLVTSNERTARNYRDDGHEVTGPWVLDEEPAGECEFCQEPTDHVTSDDTPCCPACFKRITDDR